MTHLLGHPSEKSRLLIQRCARNVGWTLSSSVRKEMMKTKGDFVDALEEVMSPSEDDDGDEYCDAISPDDDYVCDSPNEILEEEDDEVPVQDWPCTPLRKLELEYERCMNMNAEDLDSEPDHLHPRRE
ncbi:hypothetical protein PF003_g4101 [Phytophthora fragariae]|nr:hypothetical protein PF003_g4101 [Phytophthora fragariae]